MFKRLREVIADKKNEADKEVAEVSETNSNPETNADVGTTTAEEEIDLSDSEQLYQKIEKYVLETLIGYKDNVITEDTINKAIIDAGLGNGNAELILKNKIKKLIESKFRRLSWNEVEKYANAVYENNYGFGAIDWLMKDKTINEIWVNGKDHIFYEKNGIKYKSNKKIKSDDDVIRVIRLLLNQDHLDITAQAPAQEAKLRDGSRITVLIPPVARKPYINIRKFKAFSPTTENLISNGTLTSEMVEWLSKVVRGRANILIIGEAGAGKTSLLKWLIGFTDPQLRIGVLETDFELMLEEEYPERNIFTYEEHLELNITLGDLFRKCLRSSPDIIIVGEARGMEADEMIRAMRRGHSGSMSTIHTNAPETAIDDIAEMINEDGKRRDPIQLRYRVASAIDVIIQIHRMMDGKRRITRITEVTSDYETQSYTFNDKFIYKIDPKNPTQGNFVRVGKLSEKLKQKLNFYGLPISELEGL
jgi:pilus assembly protein CpaF